MLRYLVLFLMLLSACSCSHATPPTAAPALNSDLSSFLASLAPPPAASYEFDAETKPLTWKHFVPITSIQGPVTPTMAANIQATLAKATDMKVESLIIWINSPGGDVDAGETITHLIEAAPFKVHCIVDTEAASMAFYILQACDSRHMTKRSRLMVHNPFLVLQRPRTSAADLRDLLSYHQTLAHSMAEHEAKKMNISVKELERRIDHQDWWMTDEEAKKFHAVDSVQSSVFEYAKKLRD